MRTRSCEQCFEEFELVDGVEERFCSDVCAQEFDDELERGPAHENDCS